jgi:peroxin-4
MKAGAVAGKDSPPPTFISPSTIRTTGAEDTRCPSRRAAEDLNSLRSCRRIIRAESISATPRDDASQLSSTNSPVMSSDRSRGSKSGSGKASPASALKRLTHEIQDLQETPNDAVLHLGPVSDEDLFHWESVLKGPRDPSSPYYGGLWLLTISVPSNYPLAPPKVTFITPICHPNVHFTTGEICLTLLGGEHWLPSYTIGSTMSAIQQLLSDPGNDSPLNVDIANLYRDHDDVGAEGLIRFWTGEKRWNGEGKGAWISERFPGSGGKLGG